MDVASGMKEEASYRSVEGRCAVAVKNTVWVSDRSGCISIRCARTGAQQSRLLGEDSIGGKFFANMMIESLGRVWAACSNGTVRVYNTANEENMANTVVILHHPQKPLGEAVSLCAVDFYVLVGMTNRDILVCGSHQGFVESKWVIEGGKVGLEGSVVSITRHGASLVALDDAGTAVFWNLAASTSSAQGEELLTPEMMPTVTMRLPVEVGGFSCQAAVDTWSVTLWAGTRGGSIVIHTLTSTQQPSSTPLYVTPKHHYGKVTAILAAAPGKMVTGSEDKDIVVWHSIQRRPLHRLKHHTGFISALVPVYGMSSTRFWSMSGDKSATCWQLDGFFQDMQSNCDAATLRTSLLVEKASLMNANNQLRDTIHHIKEDSARKDRELEHAEQVLTTLRVRISSLEQAVDGRDSTLVGSSAERRRLQDEVSELQTRLKNSQDRVAEAEQKTSQLQARIAFLEESVTKEKHNTTEKENQVSMMDLDKKTLEQDKERLKGFLDNKDREISSLTGQLNQLREEIIQRKMAYDRLVHQSELDRRGIDEGSKNLKLILAENESLHLSVKRLSDLVLVKDNEIKEKVLEINNVSAQISARQLEYEKVLHQRDNIELQIKQLQDQYVVRTHEMETVRKDYETSTKTVSALRNDIAELSSTEGKLRWQMDQLRKDLETERNNTRLLQDQYTIFQFVVSSRGELVSSLWKLHQNITTCGKAIKDASTYVEKHNPLLAATSSPVHGVENTNTTAVPERLAMKKDWKENMTTRLVAALNAIKEVEEKSTYIVANYFSEYEKLHLGVSSYYFHPDSTRPPVVGEDLLMKLREVTPLKQVADMNRSTGAIGGAAGLPPTPTGLPPLHSVTMGPMHQVTGTASPPRSRPRKFT